MKLKKLVKFIPRKITFRSITIQDKIKRLSKQKLVIKDKKAIQPRRKCVILKRIESHFSRIIQKAKVQKKWHKMLIQLIKNRLLKTFYNKKGCNFDLF